MLATVSAAAYRTLRGMIRYTSKKPERMDQERGREYFTLTQQPDGTDVLHAHCEIDDEPMLDHAKGTVWPIIQRNDAEQGATDVP